MGRHGGGSRSGGRSSSSRSGGGSRGGGSGVRTSRTPFKGCYNRSYYDRRGRYHTCYTSSKSFGTKSGWNAGIIFSLVFITLHMCLMLTSMFCSMVHIGSKVDGDKDRIYIVDNIDVLTSSEEMEVLELLEDVYDKSGMPVTVYTDDFSWKNHYSYLTVYSEELYYNIGFDENAMIIVFTAEDDNGFYDWEYDMYCGDDTVKCLSDQTFDKLLDNFQKGMAGQDLAEALDYAWSSVMNDLAGTEVSPITIPMMLFILAFYSIFYITILGTMKKSNEAYRYFKENPDKLSTVPMTLYSDCPNCGASNATQNEICPYCGSLLKISDGKVKFVKPNE